MIKQFLIAAFLFSCNTPVTQNQVNTNSMSTNTTTPSSIHQFSVKSLDGGIINFKDFAGKKILIVNTASECGYTPQYEALQTLYTQHQSKLVVIGFPANNFGGQEPGSNENIKTFCQKNYGVTFPMAEKISVKGSDMAPIYAWLTNKDLNGVLSTDISWNFNKFLIDENGVIISKMDSNVSPLSDEIISKL